MTIWMLKTDHDPLARARSFLKTIWEYADLTGMLIPVYQAGHKSVRQTVIHRPESLTEADPFVPLMHVNASSIVSRLAQEHPHEPMAAVLRACEIKALYEQVKSRGVNLENWLMIGVDCPACFSVRDFEWRVEKAGSVEALTRDVLRNARQGGIALDRFRSACGMCSKPEAPCVDVCFDLLGLPVNDAILVEIRNDLISQKLNMHEITDGPAPQELIVQRDHMLKQIEERRERMRERQIGELAPDLPADLDQLVEFLMECQPCVECMEACPVHAEELVPALREQRVTRELARSWLLACVECGMCEQACPKELPLAAVMNRIGHELKGEVLVA